MVYVPGLVYGVVTWKRFKVLFLRRVPVPWICGVVCVVGGAVLGGAVVGCPVVLFVTVLFRSRRRSRVFCRYWSRLAG